MLVGALVELERFQLLLFEGGLCECGPHLLVDLNRFSFSVFVALNVEGLEYLFVSRDDVLRPVAHLEDMEAIRATHVRKDRGVPVEDVAYIVSGIAAGCAVFFDLMDHHGVYRPHDHFSEIVLLHVDLLETPDLLVDYLGDSVGHDEVIFLPDAGHAGAISGHFDAFSIEVDLYHIEVIIPWLDYVLPIQTDPFQDHSQLED